MKQKRLERLGYSNRIERMFGCGMMIALTGQRRVGKSCVMRRIYNHKAENEENHIINKDKKKKPILSNIIKYIREKLFTKILIKKRIKKKNDSFFVFITYN